MKIHQLSLTALLLLFAGCGYGSAKTEFASTPADHPVTRDVIERFQREYRIPEGEIAKYKIFHIPTRKNNYFYVSQFPNIDVIDDSFEGYRIYCYKIEDDSLLISV